jgi:hypothetical protein
MQLRPTWRSESANAILRLRGQSRTRLRGESFLAHEREATDARAMNLEPSPASLGLDRVDRASTRSDFKDRSFDDSGIRFGAALLSPALRTRSAIELLDVSPNGLIQRCCASVSIGIPDPLKSKCT